MSCIISVARVLFIAIIVGSTANAQQPLPGGFDAPLTLGEPGWAGVATAASGSWADQFPFNPEMYGKTRGHSPGTSRTTPTILLYCRSLDPRFMELTSRVDTLIARRPELKSSGVYLFDTKGAQQGGYTAEELIQRIKKIQELSDKHKLNVLSIAIAANSSPKSIARVGLDDSHDVMIVYFKPNVDSNKCAVVTWLRAAKTADLDKNSMDEIVKSLTAAIKPNDSGPGSQ